MNSPIVDYGTAKLMAELYDVLDDMPNAVEQSDKSVVAIVRNVNRLFLHPSVKDALISGCIARLPASLCQMEIAELRGIIQTFSAKTVIVNESDKICAICLLVKALYENWTLKREHLALVYNAFGLKPMVKASLYPDLMYKLSAADIFAEDEVENLAMQLKQLNKDRLTVGQIIATLGPEIIVRQNGSITTKRTVVTQHFGAQFLTSDGMMKVGTCSMFLDLSLAQ
ncbi:unnamed protein product [Soboliphyme baturini]|uniref:CSN8_PSD8_EIF3K domain-containing protein n=1 Tax=Soboliphyme baturini TaxID=241478 RepID=A0A183JB23_9BILA|nr:unnamed protein product [Soboliphyme baturini]